VRRPDPRRPPPRLPPRFVAFVERSRRRRAAQHVVDERVQQQIQGAFVVIDFRSRLLLLLLLWLGVWHDADPRRRPKLAGSNVVSSTARLSRRIS
jgi:hypothetical protein